VRAKSRECYFAQKCCQLLVPDIAGVVGRKVLLPTLVPSLEKFRAVRNNRAAVDTILLHCRLPSMGRESNGHAGRYMKFSDLCRGPGTASQDCGYWWINCGERKSPAL